MNKKNIITTILQSPLFDTLLAIFLLVLYIIGIKDLDLFSMALNTVSILIVLVAILRE